MNVLKWFIRWILWLYIVYRQLPHFDSEEQRIVEFPWMIGLMSAVYPPTVMVAFHANGEFIYWTIILAPIIYFMCGLILYLLFYRLRAKKIY